jgi:hypothetical protein
MHARDEIRRSDLTTNLDESLQMNDAHHVFHVHAWLCISNIHVHARAHTYMHTKYAKPEGHKRSGIIILNSPNAIHIIIIIMIITHTTFIGPRI